MINDMCGKLQTCRTRLIWIPIHKKKFHQRETSHPSMDNYIFVINSIYEWIFMHTIYFILTFIWNIVSIMSRNLFFQQFSYMSFHPLFFFSPLVFLFSFSSSTLPLSSFPLPIAKPCITCSPRFQYNLECHYLSHIITPTFYSFPINNLIVKWHITRMVYIKLINISVINNLFPYFMLIILKEIVTLYFGTTLGYATICQLKEWSNVLLKCKREF